MQAAKEWQVVSNLIPILEGCVGDEACVYRQIPFTNLDHLTDASLVPGNPDRYYGVRLEQFDRKIRNNLKRFIVPSTQSDLPILPIAVLAIKGPDSLASVALRQASYNGALIAR
jgi:hypothetical protein